LPLLPASQEGTELQAIYIMSIYRGQDKGKGLFINTDKAGQMSCGPHHLQALSFEHPLYMPAMLNAGVQEQYARILG
jgi:hypothetical protein